MIDATPSVVGKRGAEIEAWLQEHSVDNYAIIDDLAPDNFTPNQIRPLFICNPYTGLDNEAAGRIIACLDTVRHIGMETYTSSFTSIHKLKFRHKAYRIMSIMAVLILIKWLWASIAMEGVGTIDGERGTILRRRNSLSTKVITSPQKVLQEMPVGIGEQFKGVGLIYLLHACSGFCQHCETLSWSKRTKHIRHRRAHFYCHVSGVQGVMMK